MRSSRLLSILILLQLRGRVTAQALAAEYEVSIRTIYRDMDALSAAGVPLYGDKGPGGGFQLLDGYRTRLTGLDQAEADALLLAGMPDAAAALGLGDAAKRAGRKMLAALPVDAAGSASHVRGRVHLDHSGWYRVSEPSPQLEAVASALFAERRVAFGYDSWTQRRDWTVDPLGLVAKEGNWYLVGQSGEKILTFRVSQIADLKALEAPSYRPKDFDLPTWWDASVARFEAELRPLTALVRASPVGVKRLAALGAFAERAVADAGPADRAGWRDVQLPVEQSDHSALALLGCGPELEVIQPPALRHRLAELAAAVVARMAGQVDDETSDEQG
jgi:predicted DNA-binding transcriptional regulator YafY